MKLTSLATIIALAFSTPSLANVSIDMFKMGHPMNDLFDETSVEEFQ